MQISEICKNPSCDVQNCNLRHPQICKYFCDYKKCKFGEWCFFFHQESDKFSKKIIDDLEKDINKKLEDSGAKIKQIDEKIAEIEKDELKTMYLKIFFKQKLKHLTILF